MRFAVGIVLLLGLGCTGDFVIYKVVKYECGRTIAQPVGTQPAHTESVEGLVEEHLP